MESDTKSIDDLRQEVRYLKNELSMARHGIIQMVPEHLQQLLNSSRCRDFDELAIWNRETIEKVIDLAEPIERSEAEERLDSRPHAFCPLCGADSAGYAWIKGYVIPKGLEMHLDGVGNARRCPVMYAAFRMATDRLW